MAKALFVTTKDLKRYSALSGNVDPDKLTYMIEVSQDTEVQNYLGTKLFEKLQNLIIAGTINDPVNAKYKTLLVTYVKPMSIFWALVYFVPFSAYTIANGGVFKGQTEQAVTVSKNEVDYLSNKYRDLAQYYTNNFIDFMIYNQSDYPEYNANKNDDTFPSYSADFGGWWLS
ncbi:MAG: hypothetical protein GOVbin2181_39 [Prokaryotic dsDNA virus sp.]|nr:MAG: hypothetical protein GOVbin2181_39 [Prokaryotic dsDNA virus sp.]|tara:strand:+ start:13076 stop:13591 length:516 start_codon:yes stop_codon:yes gene_type:complete